MKLFGFHRGVYAEGMRRLRTLGLTATILCTVFCSLPTVLQLLQNGPYDGSSLLPWYYHDMIDVYPFLLLLPFILPTVFTAILFAFQNNRRDSDFYHSLPVTRSTLHLSLLAAIATWCGIVIFVSSAVVGPLSVITKGPMDFLDAVLTVLGAFVSCLFVLSVVFLGYTLSGNTASALFASGILLFAPTIISEALAAVMADDIQVVRVSSLALTNYQLLYVHDSLAAWIVTIVVTLLCFGIGLWIGARRPSETAGRPSITPKLQHLFRLLLAFTVCLLPITEIYEMGAGSAFLSVYNLSTVIEWYLVALAVYFLFELITTKKAKNLLKAVPWLGVLAAMNVVCLVGMHATVFAINTMDKAAHEDVTSVQLIEPMDYWSYEKEANGGVQTLYRPHDDPSYGPFEDFAEAYVNSVCPSVAVDTSTICYYAQQAIDRTIDYRDNEDEGEILSQVARNAPDTGGYIYQVELRVKTGIFSRDRVVYLYDNEMRSLLMHIDVQVDVPQLDTILAWN